jgi:hypothetical protein
MSNIYFTDFTIDRATSGLVTHGEFHHMVHKGVAYEASTSVTADAYFEFKTTGAKAIHLLTTINTDSSDCTVQFFATTTPSTGSSLPSYNKKVGGTAATWTIKQSASQAITGALSSTQYIFASTQSASNNQTRDSEIVIPASASGFVVKFVAPAKSSIAFAWYEVE